MNIQLDFSVDTITTLYLPYILADIHSNFQTPLHIS